MARLENVGVVCALLSACRLRSSQNKLEMTELQYILSEDTDADFPDTICRDVRISGCIGEPVIGQE